MARKKTNKKLEKSLNKDEKLLVKLDSVVRATKDDSIKSTLISLRSWYLTNHWWTPKQVRLVESTIERQNQTVVYEKKAKKKFYVYAISNGDEIKVGYSNNINSRKSALSTSSPKPLTILGKVYVGDTEGKAKAAERDIHNMLSDYHVRGEWFTSESIDTINNWMEARK